MPAAERTDDVEYGGAARAAGASTLQPNYAWNVARMGFSIPLTELQRVVIYIARAVPTSTFLKLH